MEEVFHPENETEVFETPDEISDALDDGDLVPLPDEPALGWEPDQDIGELAGELDQSPELYRALRPEALATLTYLAGLVREQSGAATPAAGDERRPRPHLPGPARAVELQATAEYSLHTTGWAFDIRRDYESKQQARSVPVRARPPQSLGADRLRGRARRDPRHRLGPGGGAAQAVAGLGGRPRGARRARGPALPPRTSPFRPHPREVPPTTQVAPSVAGPRP